MPRAIWTGSISFGLLNVPVKLYSAVSSRSISFRELRESDGSRVRHKRVAEADGEEVDYDEIVKGYEIAPDQYVVMTRDELAELAPEKTKAIEIEDFVDLDEIDPIYFNQPYYLGPTPGAERAYGLLVKSMHEERKVAIARFVLRNKEHLAAIRPMEGVLTLATMRFADEIVSPKALDGIVPEEAEDPKPKELKMARTLIDSLTSEFDATAYHDQYREQLLELIERKGSGEKIVAAEAEEPKPTKAPDLMAALEESLAAVKSDELGGGGGAKRKGKAPAKKTARKSKSSGSKKAKSKSKAKAGK